MTRPFHITLSPIRSDAVLEVSRTGEVLVVNGLPLDCTELPEGGRIAAGSAGCEALISDILAEAGALHLTLLLPHGPEAGQAALFPAPLILSQDGAARLPTDPEAG